MIVAVEGVSASGKTTWCRRHAPEATVPEYVGPVSAGDAIERAQFWARVNAGRWQQALELERATGVAFCDTDPIKLHYTWCLWQLKRLDDEEWYQTVRANRHVMSRRALGFPDRILLLEPDDDTIRAQRDNDDSRGRHNFELHLSLKALLRRWYQTLEELAPGRVIINPQTLTSVPELAPRDDRYDLDVFEKLIDELSSP
jgi:hypothetical protein